jgi:hypothetical protein
MSAVATRDGAALDTRAPQLGDSSPKLFEPTRVTLEDLVLGVWEDLRLEGHAECPVCGAELTPAGCQGCGSELE